eukprot:3144646-Alexandrium_andersonii.AAC.1
MEAAGSERRVPLAPLLWWLFRFATMPTRYVARSLFCWIGWLLQAGALWGGASDDAICDAPVAMGPMKARRLDRGLLQAMGRAMGQGSLGSTPGRLAVAIGRFRRWRVQKANSNAAQQGMLLNLRAYKEFGRRAFCPELEPIVSLSCDGTRMGGKDTLYACLWAPGQE